MGQGRIFFKDTEGTKQTVEEQTKGKPKPQQHPAARGWFSWEHRLVRVVPGQPHAPGGLEVSGHWVPSATDTAFAPQV